MTHWLLDLDVDTQTVRLAEVALDVVRDDGTVLHYAQGVVVEPVTEEISLLDPSVASPEAQLTLWLGTATPLALLRAGGGLSRWTEGTTYESRRKVVSGRFQAPQQLDPEEGISATLSQDVWIDQETLTRTSEAVTTTTWATASTLTAGALDLLYPIVIGHPGRTSSTGSVPALVALRIASAPVTNAFITPNYHSITYLIANHHVTATRCRLSTETNTAGITARVLNTKDDKGQPVAVCPWFWSASDAGQSLTFNSANTYAFTGGSPPEVGVGYAALPVAYNTDVAQPAVYASYSDSVSPASGGLQVNGQVIRAAGDVLSWALSRSGISVDSARMASARGALAGYEIDAVIAERCSPWDWVTQVLLPILPCSVAAGPDGLYVVPLFLDAVEADCEARLDTRRPDVQLAGPVTWETSKMARSVTVRGQYDVRTSTYTRQVVYGSQQAADDDPAGAVLPHATLTAAAGFRLPGADLVLETAAVYEATTLALVASTLARIYGLPLGTMSFDVAEEDPRFGLLRCGSIVYCYDAPNGIDRVGQVYSIVTHGDNSLTVAVWLFLDPSRDSLQ